MLVAAPPTMVPSVPQALLAMNLSGPATANVAPCRNLPSAQGASNSNASATRRYPDLFGALRDLAVSSFTSEGGASTMPASSNLGAHHIRALNPPQDEITSTQASRPTTYGFSSGFSGFGSFDGSLEPSPIDLVDEVVAPSNHGTSTLSTLSSFMPSSWWLISSHIRIPGAFGSPAHLDPRPSVAAGASGFGEFTSFKFVALGALQPLTLQVPQDLLPPAPLPLELR